MNRKFEPGDIVKVKEGFLRNGLRYDKYYVVTGYDEHLNGDNDYCIMIQNSSTSFYEKLFEIVRDLTLVEKAVYGL